MNQPSLPSTRRDCLKTLGSLGLLTLGARAGFAAEAAHAVRHLTLPLGEVPEVTPGNGMITGFVRFGWKAFAVGGGDGRGSVLQGLGRAAPSVPEGAECRLRLTNAIDVRDQYNIEVSTPGGQAIGRFDLKFAGLYQVQEIRLRPEQARAVLIQGAVLRLVSGPGPTWFFGPSPHATPAPDPVQLPHVLIAAPGDPSGQFEQRLRGLVMLQGFGWQSGCVTEGLLDLADVRRDGALRQAVDRYLGMYLTADGLAFESPTSLPRNRVSGTEEPVALAALARRQPDHPALRTALDFLTSPSTSRLASLDTSLTTEGNFTLAYPMAVLARVLKHPELATLALRNLEARRLACVHDGDIYQRSTMGGQNRLRNWCRGVCWYYLGLVRTLETLQEPRAVTAWLPEVRRVAALLRKYQRKDGLWGNFLHDPKSVPDTSGSAGLAAALARAQAAGWLENGAREAAQHALSGLVAHLTPDGLLGGVAQSNKGGNALQESDYRVIYQMGMGLKAQLMAALALG